MDHAGAGVEFPRGRGVTRIAFGYDLAMPHLISRHSSALKVALRWLAAIGFTLAGANHFRSSGFYQRIIPPQFPLPRLLVQVSGACEIIGGIALLIPRLRRAASWGLIALLIAVFPANLYMAAAPDRFRDLHLPTWALWLRLPLQAALIGWIWFVSDPCTPTAKDEADSPSAAESSPPAKRMR
jgi:uncharacterized membrane protein